MAPSHPFAILLLCACMFGRAASAADPVEVTVDKGYLLRLERDAKTVLVAEPRIADAVIESPRLVFILGRRPGETNIFILDRMGRPIRETDVIVVPKGPNHVTVNRRAQEATLSCFPRCARVPTPGRTGQRRLGATRSGQSGSPVDATKGNTKTGGR